MQEMQEAGADTIAQDEKTSVVWGMPGAAAKLGAADSILPLGQIAKKIILPWSYKMECTGKESCYEVSSVKMTYCQTLSNGGCS